MTSQSKIIIKRFVWLLPLIIVTIGIFYFINLFERLSERDLNRQISEKSQLITLTETLSNNEDIKHSIMTLDTFDNIYAYLLKDNQSTFEENSTAEIYHSADCPFILKSHPHENEEIKNTILTRKRGSLATKENNGTRIVWEFRHFKANNEKLLVITGITNYKKEPIDKELEISIGLMLLITALLNWALVGFWKYKCCGSCKIEKKGK